MKIFAAAMNYPQHNKQEGEALYNNVGKPVVYTKTDSALLKGGRPFFVPDELSAIFSPPDFPSACPLPRPSVSLSSTNHIRVIYGSYTRIVVDELDFGVDFAFLGSRLSGTLDYYNRTTRNVVFYVPIATGGGTAELLSNNGTVRNSGIEFSLGWSDTVGEDFSYNIGLNLTTIDNKVMELKGRDYIPGALVRGNYTTRTMVGYPIGSFWGYEIDGVYASEGEALRDPVSQTIKDEGYFKYTNQDGNDVIDDNDKVYLGSPIPKLIGGLDFSFTWKNLDFSVFLYGVYGNDILYNNYTFSPRVKAKRWTPDNPTNDFPRLNNGRQYLLSDYFIQDGSFLRIQNVNLGYTIPFKKAFIKNIKISANIENLYTFTKFDGYDPEVGLDGIYWGGYPKFRKYTVGLELNF